MSTHRCQPPVMAVAVARPPQPDWTCPVCGRTWRNTAVGAGAGWIEVSGPTVEYDLVGSERDVLLYHLNKNRDLVVRRCEALTVEQMRAPGVPTGTNLLGIITHLTGVEKHWFQRVFLGEPAEVDFSMDVPVHVSPGEVLAAYRAACARSDEIVRACPDLSTTARLADLDEGEVDAGQRDSLRRLLAHMIEETARHVGQADILREQVDGATEL